MYWEGDLLFREGVSLNFHPKSIARFQEVEVQDSHWFGDTAPACFGGSMAYEVQEERNEISRSINRISALCIESAER